MVDTDGLRGLIAQRGLSQRKVAKSMGIAEKTFYLKMKRGVFRSDEIEQLISLLEIKDPCRIFFTSVGAQ